MTNSIHTVLSPLLIISCIFGLRIIEYPAGNLCFGLLYMLSLWTIHYLFLVHCTILMIPIHNNANLYTIFRGLNVFTALLSIISGIYHDKKFRNCIKKLDIVDATLGKLGIVTNHQHLHKKIIWIVRGWFAIAIILTCIQAIFLKQQFHFKAATALYLTLTLNYCTHINLIGDLTMTSIIGYIGLKFEQINDQLQTVASDNKRGIKQAWQNAVLHLPQCRVSKTPSSKWVIRILMHLHLELRKISREIDWIFGIQMTFKMGCYFAFMTGDLNNLFIWMKNYATSFNRTLCISIILFWLFHHILKLLIINYICEKVSTQANSTKHFINKISFSMCDVEMCENISQLLLHIVQSPLRFCGFGLFQFGYKFINGFIKSVGTVVVILIQVHGHK